MSLHLAFDTTLSPEIYFKDSSAKNIAGLFTRLLVTVALVTIQKWKCPLETDYTSLQRIRNISD